MTLLDAFKKATIETNVFEDYIDTRKKYLRALIVGTDAYLERINGISPLTKKQSEEFEEMALTLTCHFSEQQKKLKEQLLKLVKHIDLHKCKIMEYTEFDMIEWDLEAHDWNYFYVKFRPKGANVSFWRYKASEIEYN